MAHRAPRLLRRLAGVAAASGLALAGLVAVAAPASAKACSGSTGVTVVVDTGSTISTACASGNPSSALKALTAAGFSVTYPQQFPGAVVCRINGYPASDPCVRMPPASAYWAFFHAKRGGGWVYSSTGVASYDPAPGTVVGFRFGSGQQPGIAPPAASAPKPPPKPSPTKTTAKPTPTTKPKPTARPSTRTTAAPGTTAPGTRQTAGTSAGPTTAPTATPTTATPSAGATASGGGSPSATGTASPDSSPTASDVAAAPTSADSGGGSGPGTLAVGIGLVALVAAGAGWAAWKRRG